MPYLCIIIITQKHTAMTNLKTLSKEELGAFLEPLTNLAAQMISAGVLKKTVIKHFTNRGLSFEAAENITEVGVFKAEQFLKHKAK